MAASVPTSVAIDQAQEIKALKAALDLASGEVERLRTAIREFRDWSDERVKHGIIFPEELSVRSDGLRGAPLIDAQDVLP